MQENKHPLVSVVTPVYNTEEFIGECIDSVLSQKYTNFEYVILDNCSTDGSLHIAEDFAERDSRIRVIRGSEFLDQLPNYNRALGHISSDSRYCKVVQADDRIYPTCLSDMVAVAESDPSVGVVSAYTHLDFGSYASVYLWGLPLDRVVFSGREICRRFFTEGLHVFGSPTMTMFRSEIVRANSEFYEDSVIADSIVYFQALQEWNLGFVPKVLTYTRRYNESYMTLLRQFHYMTVIQMIGLYRFGKVFLTDEEYGRCKRRIEKSYRLAIGESLLRRRPQVFWDFQARAMEEMGEDLSRWFKLQAGIAASWDLALNPKRTVERLVAWNQKRGEAPGREGSLEAEPGVEAT